MEKYKNIVIFCMMTAVLFSCNSLKVENNTFTLWHINSLTHIGGNVVEPMGNPKVINSTMGKAVSFDGNGDRLLVNANPLGDAQEFTIEIVFKPNDVFPNNKEPRFFHIESDDNSSRRITMELRLNDKHQWYLDAYIKSDHSQFTLIDSAKVHPAGKWAHAAITYKDHKFVSYVNGVKESTGEVEYLPIPQNAKTSIGARINKVNWFNGNILQIRVTKKVLQPKEFMLIGKLKNKLN